jgi:succinate dehydrogenase / fumarate reductase cytochrome b subunit
MQVAVLPRSSIGKKAIMAVTGVGVDRLSSPAYVGQPAHLPGAESFNHYAEFLRTVGEPVFRMPRCCG